MRVRINELNTFYYTTSDVIEPLDIRGDVLVVIDPGKTNMGVIVGSPWGEVYEKLEFSGSDDFVRSHNRGKVLDTTVYCSEVKKFLTDHLAGCNVIYGGVEKSVGYKEMEQYTSQLVLTEIRAAILSTYLDVFKVKGDEIPNFAWKGKVLPDGYRGHSEKGSKRYLEGLGIFCKTHDMTDVLCIYAFVVVTKFQGKYRLKCDQVDISGVDYDYGIYPSFIPYDSLPVFDYNPGYSLKENLQYVTNRSYQRQRASVPVSALELSDIYGKSYLFDSEHSQKCEKVQVVVWRSA